MTSGCEYCPVCILYAVASVLLLLLLLLRGAIHHPLIQNTDLHDHSLRCCIMQYAALEARWKPNRKMRWPRRRAYDSRSVGQRMSEFRHQEFPSFRSDFTCGALGTAILVPRPIAGCYRLIKFLAWSKRHCILLSNHCTLVVRHISLISCNIISPRRLYAHSPSQSLANPCHFPLLSAIWRRILF